MYNNSANLGINVGGLAHVSFLFLTTCGDIYNECKCLAAISCAGCVRYVRGRKNKIGINQITSTKYSMESTWCLCMSRWGQNRTRECPKTSKIFSYTKTMSVQLNTKLMYDIQRFYNLPQSDWKRHQTHWCSGTWQKFCLCVFGEKKSIYQRGEDVRVFVCKVTLNTYLRSLPQTRTALWLPPSGA